MRQLLLALLVSCASRTDELGAGASGAKRAPGGPPVAHVGRMMPLSQMSFMTGKAGGASLGRSRKGHR